MSEPMIAVEKDKDIIFYHVMNDTMRYLDLTSVKRNHPELKEYIERNSFNLQREFFQLNEK